MKIILEKGSQSLPPSNCFIQIVVMKTQEPESFPPTSSMKLITMKALLILLWDSHLPEVIPLCKGLAANAESF